MVVGRLVAFSILNQKVYWTVLSLSFFRRFLNVTFLNVLAKPNQTYIKVWLRYGGQSNLVFRYDVIELKNGRSFRSVVEIHLWGKLLHQNRRVVFSQV